MLNIEEVTKVIGKDTYVFHIGNCSCRVYRKSNKAKWWAKREWIITFYSKEELVEKLANFRKRVLSIQEAKEQRRQQSLKSNKEARAKAIQWVKVWDVFKSSFGYDMTINEFYQVVKINGKKVTVREIWKKTTYWDDGFSWRQIPDLDNFIGEEQSYIISPSGWLKVAGYRHAYKCNANEDHYFNYLD